jgi:hypothetical protein
VDNQRLPLCKSVSLVCWTLAFMGRYCADLSDVELTAAARGLAMSLALTSGNDGLPLLATPRPFEQLHHLLESRPYRGSAGISSGPRSIAGARSGAAGGHNGTSPWTLSNLRAAALVDASDSALNSLLAALVSSPGAPAASASAGRGPPLPRTYYLGIPIPFGGGGEFGTGPAARYQVDVTSDALNNSGASAPLAQAVPGRAPGPRGPGLSAFGMMQARSHMRHAPSGMWPTQFVLHFEREAGMDDIEFVSGLSSSEMRMYGPSGRDAPDGGSAPQTSAVQLVLDAEREQVAGASNRGAGGLAAPVNTLTVPPPLRSFPHARGATAAAAASSADLTGSQLRTFFRAANFADAAQLTVRGTSAGSRANGASGGGGTTTGDGRSESITHQLLSDAVQRASAASAAAGRSGGGGGEGRPSFWEYSNIRRRAFDVSYPMFPGPRSGMPSGQGRGEGEPAADEPSMLLARQVCAPVGMSCACSFHAQMAMPSSLFLEITIHDLPTCPPIKQNTPAAACCQKRFVRWQGSSGQMVVLQLTGWIVHVA